jgi:hypothetical protein
MAGPTYEESSTEVRKGRERESMGLDEEGRGDVST